MRPRPITILALLCGVLGACSLFQGAPRQNILFVVVNSLRFDAISSSIGAAETPVLHELAARGVWFSSCFSHSSSSLAAQTALLSARPPTESGVAGDNLPIPDDLPLLAEHLREQGFSTFADLGLRALRAPVGDTGIERGFDVHSSPEGPDARASRVSERTVDFLRGSSKSTSWFAYVTFSDLTEPYEADPASSVLAEILLDDQPLATAAIGRLYDKELRLTLPPGEHRLTIRSEASFLIETLSCHQDEGPLPVRFETGRLGRSLQGAIVVLENASDAEMHCRVSVRMHDLPQLPEIRARYKQEVESIDRALGSILAELKALDLEEDTLIVLTADHGASLGEHEQIGHADNLHDEVLRVPLILLPSARSRHQTDLRRNPAATARHCDIVPTVLEMLELDDLPGASGLSLLEEHPRRLLAEVASPTRGTILALRDDRYKLVYFAAEERSELYDLRADSLELEDVYERTGFERLGWPSELKALADAPSR